MRCAGCTVAVRWGLTVALLAGVYTETGPFTVLALLLTVLAIEIFTIVLWGWPK